MSPSPEVIVHIPTRSFISLIVAAAGLLATGCSDATGPAPDEELASIALIAPPASIAVGTTVQFAATTLNSQGAAISGHPLRWESAQPAIASVSSTGAVTGVAAGVTTIRAISGTRAASATLTVERAVCTAAMATATVVPGQPATGTIGATDCLFPGGGPTAATGRRLTLSQPTALRVELSSDQFAALLIVTDQAMNPVAVGAADAPGEVARITHHFAAGTYVVWVSTFSEAASGSFTLQASPVTMCAASTTAGAIAPSQAVQGALTGSSCLLPNLLRAEGWVFSVSETTVLRVDSHGNGFQPVLIVTGVGEDLPIVTFGIPPFSGPTSILHQFEPGEYRLWVSSFDEGSGGYSLSMATATLPSCDEIEGAVAVGQAVQGTLAIDDCALPDGRRADLWELTLAAPVTLRVDQVSGQFDSYLIIRDQSGNVVAEDDDGGNGLDSRIERAFAAGTYRITATGYSPMALGAYGLSVQAVAPGIVLADEVGALPDREPKLKRAVPGVAGWHDGWGVPRR